MWESIATLLFVALGAFGVLWRLDVVERRLKRALREMRKELLDETISPEDAGGLLTELLAQHWAKRRELREHAAASATPAPGLSIGSWNRIRAAAIEKHGLDSDAADRFMDRVAETHGRPVELTE